MSSRLRKLPLAVLALVAVLALSACGDSHTRVTTGTYAGEGGKAAPYLDVGPLVYQVEVSRELNPFNSEDASYLQGVSEGESKLEPNQEWFAVFVQVYNTTNQSHEAADEFTITDTQNHKYTPLTLSQANAYAYRAGTVAAHGQLPLPDTTAGEGPTAGALLLFKIPVESLSNRPFQIKIVDSSDPQQTASAELDV
jgi:hypothetical protein